MAEKEASWGSPAPDRLGRVVSRRARECARGPAQWVVVTLESYQLLLSENLSLPFEPRRRISHGAVDVPWSHAKHRSESKAHGDA
jgi:hypothetical protein